MLGILSATDVHKLEYTHVLILHYLFIYFVLTNLKISRKMEKQRNLRFQYKRRRVRKEDHNVLFVCLFVCLLFNAIFTNISVISWPSIYNTCALSKHIGNTHIYLYASTVHMYCINPAILNRK
jgi:hypothetical protein